MRACSVNSVLSISLQRCGLQPARLLCPWDFPGKNIGVGCCAVLQGIFWIQGLNLCLLHLLAGRFFTTWAPWAYPNPVWPHLKLITSVKTLFPNKVTITGPRGWMSAYILKRDSSSHITLHLQSHVQRKIGGHCTFLSLFQSGEKMMSWWVGRPLKRCQ